MREVVYTFLNGDLETKSYTEKKEMEKRYGKCKIELREIPKDKPKLSPIRKAMLEQFGYVSENLLDKIVV